MSLEASLPVRFACLAASGETVARRAYEWALPRTPTGWSFTLLGLALVLALAVILYWRDTTALSRWWCFGLTSLRLCVLVSLIIIAFDPQQRTQKVAFRPSRVVLLVDRSLSMQLPADSSSPNESAPLSSETRFEAVERLLTETKLIDELAKVHEVSIYAFDRKLAGPIRIIAPSAPGGEPSSRASESFGTQASQSAVENQSAGAGSAAQTPPWLDALQPRGVETRLGECLVELLRQVGGRTLSGIVVLTDGASNAGIEPTAAHSAALAAKTCLVTVGVGSLNEPPNLQIVSLQSPTDVQVGDGFDLSAFVQSNGLEPQPVRVELYQKLEDEQEPTLVESRELTLADNAVPVEARFTLNPSAPGETEYTVRTELLKKIPELTDTDNERHKTVNLVDRKTRVLLIAGGPSREYRFVRNLLFRHAAIELDVWLQTVDPGTAVSQDADHVLTSFPGTREELFPYDVIVSFDGDWGRVSAEQIKTLKEWVFAQSGGLILVAGDVYTPQLAGDQASKPSILELFPVVLTPFLIEYQLSNESQQAWPITWTQAGREADFLQIVDDPYQTQAAWQEFPGVFRCYPTSGAKAGATLYATHTDPRSQTEFGPPILMASQFYGAGQVFYLGTSEMWRLRALNEQYHERLWTKTVRKVGQARLQRGTDRGLLLLERSEYLLGQTVTLRAQLLDPQFRPLDAPAVAVEVYTPNGTPINPEPKLLPDKDRPGQYVGTFLASTAGAYRVELAIPQSNDTLSKKINVGMPKWEIDDARQNAQLLRSLVQDTGGTYLPLADAQDVPDWLPNQGEEYLVDDRLQTLWDRDWVMVLLIALLAIEWLTRKLLKLA